MYKVIIKGFKHLEEAEDYIDWINNEFEEEIDRYSWDESENTVTFEGFDTLEEAHEAISWFYSECEEDIYYFEDIEGPGCYPIRDPSKDDIINHSLSTVTTHIKMI